MTEPRKPTVGGWALANQPLALWDVQDGSKEHKKKGKKRRLMLFVCTMHNRGARRPVTVSVWTNSNMR